MIQIQFSIKPERSTSFTLGTIPYMHKEDRAIRGYVRTCAPCPAVWTLKEDNHVFLNQQWQYFLLAINENMTRENVYLLLDDHLAFANNTGFGSLGTPNRIDYFFNRLNYAKFPQLDKVRTCSRSTLTGVETYRAVQAIRDVLSLLQSRLRAGRRTLAGIRQILVSPNTLNVKTFDSRLPPPLKPGRSYPSNISQINPDDYLYTPRYSREMFLVATIVNRSGEVVQFPRGGLYSWTGDGTPYSFLPHISNPSFGLVQVPLNNFIKLTKDAVVPSPYRRN